MRLVSRLAALGGNISFIWRAVGLMALGVLPVACGGDGSREVPNSLEAPDEVTLSVEEAKVFRFDWRAADGATHYKLLENPDGMSGFTQVGEDISGGESSFVLEVPLYARVNAQYILQACNTAICFDGATLSVSGHLEEGVGYLKASNTDVDDVFGSAVSLSADGHMLAIGAPGEDSGNGSESDNSVIDAGAVYVFARGDAGIWVRQAYLKASNADAEDSFGETVSLSADGRTLAVGAMYEGSGATGVNSDQYNNTTAYAGAVYVFARSDDEWLQQAYLKASNTGPADLFGSDLSLSANGNTLAVGAKYEDGAVGGNDGHLGDNSVTNSGAVYMFARNNGVWVQQAYLKASNADVGDNFGAAVSLSADGLTLAVGAREESSGASGMINGDQDDNSAPGSGAVYMFARTVAGSWVQQAYLKASNVGAGDWFGADVSLSADGQTLAVGAKYEESAASGVDGNWHNNAASGAGAVYVFGRSNVTWKQHAYLKAGSVDAEDWFGSTVSLSADGRTLAVGGYGEDSVAVGVNGSAIVDEAQSDGAGAVYVFTNRTGVWQQQAYLKASNTGASDRFGYDVSLSAGGHALAVGAPFEDSEAAGISGDQESNSAQESGAVYLY